MHKIAKFLFESGMLVLDPTIEHVDLVLRELKKSFGVDIVNHPIFDQFLTYREGSSNKFHLFVVFKHEGDFIGANAYGRIGYAPKVIEIIRSKNQQEAIIAVKRKISVKVAKGYVLH
jgi:hypothetical protein